MKNKIPRLRNQAFTKSTIYSASILIAGVVFFAAAAWLLRHDGAERLLPPPDQTESSQTQTYEPVKQDENVKVIVPVASKGGETPQVPSPRRSVDVPTLLGRSLTAIDTSLENFVIETSESEKPRADKPYEAQRFRNMQLMDENGEIPLDGLQNARDQMDLMRSRQTRIAKAAGKPEGLEVAGIGPGGWTWLGPGNIGGRIRSMVIDPTNPNNIFVGSVSGGVWKTENAGVQFFPLTDFMANLAVATLAIDPTDPNILYAGTGEAFTSSQNPATGFQGSRGDGIFKTTNGGATWTQLIRTRVADPLVCPTIASCPWTFVNRLAISPDGSTILAATNSDGVTVGLYWSADDGATWNVANAPFAGTYLDVDFDPTNSLNAIASGGGASIWSVDGGRNWTAATPVLTGRVEIAYAPSNPSIVYASVNRNNGEVYRSTNGGRTFSAVNTGNSFFNDGGGNQGGYDNIIWVNPQDPSFVIVGGIHLWRSIDSGANFTQISRNSANSAHPDHHMIVAHPGFNNTTNKAVYFANDGGIYGALDVSTVTQTSGWTNLNNNLGVTQFYGAAANSAGVIVGGTQDNGTLRYSGDAQNWTTMSGGDGGYSAADPAYNNFFYGEYINLGIVRSTNGGTSSDYIYCNPVPTDPNGGACAGTGITDAFNGANFIAPFILDPNNSDRMLAGGLSLWRTNDVKNVNPAQNNGLPTWAAIKPPVSNGLIPPTIIPISAITVSPNNPDFAVVGHNNGRIYLSLDATGTNPPTTGQCVAGNSPCWSRIDLPAMPTRFVTRLTIDETRSPNWIYATFGGFSNDNIWVTKDLGASWTDVSGSGSTGLPSVPVRSLVINPVRPNFIYVGTEVGVFASQDAGASWELPQGGPANVSVDELFFNAGRLFAVTYGLGVYKTSTSLYQLAACSAPPTCTCGTNRWDCPCAWTDGHVPTANEDAGIQCPMQIAADNQGQATAKNLTIMRGASLTVNSSLGLSGDLTNNGVINGTSTFASIGARNITNFRRENAVTTDGTINFAGSISTGTMTGDVTNTGDFMIQGSLTSGGTLTNRGVMSIGPNLTTGNLTTFQNSILTVNNGVTVKGDVTNEGSITANQLTLNSSPAGVHNFRGGGVWRFSTLSIGSGFTVRLGGDVTFDIANLSNNGTLDLQDRTLNFRGINFFNNTGTVAGTGTFRFAPSDGTVMFAHQGPNFAPAVVIQSGSIEYQSGGTINGPFTVDAGATFGMNTSGQLTLTNTATIDGSLTKFGLNPVLNFNGPLLTNNGSIGNLDFLVFNSGGTTLTQTIAGNGSWSPVNFHIGQNPPSNTTLSMANNMSWASNALNVLSGSTLNIGGNTLTLTGPVNFLHPGAVTGNGSVRMQPTSGVPVIGNQFVSNGAWGPSLEIATGTVRLVGMTVDRNLTVNSGATLSMVSFGPTVLGDVTINGTLNAFSGSPIFNFRGTSFTNNGSVTGSTLFFGNSDRAYTQNLSGTGTWTGVPNLFIHSNSTTTLLSDVTYNGNALSNDGRINTGAFTLSVPCTTSWGGSGDVFGNIRRTNLAACPGASIAYGNPFTTIQFASGTPPTEITVNVSSSAPAGFPDAVMRTYLISPIGGSGYSATLRLHYLDSELNGNNESSMQLWRSNGTYWAAHGVSNRNTTQNWVEYNNVTQFSPWTIANLEPTAAGVSISGRVSNTNGSGIYMAWVTVTDSNGNTQTALTNPFGYYRFYEITAGATYVVSVRHKSHTFVPRLITVNEDLTDIDFVEQP